MTYYEIFSLLLSFCAGAGLIWVGYNTNRITNNQYKISSRQSYLSVYDLVTEALGHVFVDGTVKDPAKDLFWKARDRARLELPKEIEDYCQGLFDYMWEAYCLYYHKLYGDEPLPLGEERSKAADKHLEIISILIKERPHKIFSKYMKVEK